MSDRPRSSAYTADTFNLATLLAIHDEYGVDPLTLSRFAAAWLFANPERPINPPKPSQPPIKPPKPAERPPSPPPHKAPPEAPPPGPPPGTPQKPDPDKSSQAGTRPG
jgi:hypothetical protein